ncbi:MAG: LptF/LptG family permease [Chlamydiales bacterium]|nr:LptF/LptG family permease [Chlamydiales bacterium]
MILTKIWQRYIFKEALKVFLFFIIGFYFLYVLIDYSVHVKNFTYARFSILDLSYYYSSHFTKRAGIIIPFALMLATIKVLSSLNNKRELVALSAGGLSFNTILRPLFLFAFLCMTLLYLNTEFLLPNAEIYLKNIEKEYVENKLDKTTPTLFTIQMKDGSVLVYQNFDPKQNLFFDVFWIKDSDHITRIKYLELDGTVPKGRYVDVLVRNKNNQLSLQHSFEETTFPTLHPEEEAIQESIIPISGESLTELFTEIYHSHKKPLEEKGELIAHFSYKLLMPLITLAVVLIPAPYCMRFSRNLPLFFIYCVSIFGFVVMITLMDAAFIVAENQLLPPFITILLPIIVIYSIAIYHYALLHKN